MMTVPACLAPLDPQCTPGAGRRGCVRITPFAVPAVVEHVPGTPIHVRRPSVTGPTPSDQAATSHLATPPTLQRPHSHTSSDGRT